MRRSPIVRVAVVCFSLFLLGGYLYFKAYYRVSLAPPPAAAATPPAVPVTASPAAEPPTLMGGSKSMAVLTPEEEKAIGAPVVAEGEQATETPKPDEHKVLPSSKSGRVFGPKDVKPASQPAQQAKKSTSP